jgi:hypothetical protein
MQKQEPYQIVPIRILGSIILSKSEYSTNRIEKIIHRLRNEDSVNKLLCDLSTKISEIVDATFITIPGAIDIATEPQEALIANSVINFFLGSFEN